MFACPRDSEANVLRLGFREGTVSKFGRNAYHAFTEYAVYIAQTLDSARAYWIGGILDRGQIGSEGLAGAGSLGLFSAGRCNAAAAPHVT